MTADPAIARVDAGADTVHWGYFDARLSPLLTIESGDRVTISTVSGSPEVLPPPPFEIPAALLAIHAAKGPQRFFGHICTGPVAVRGAKAGQVLQVDIEKSSRITTGVTTSCGRLPAHFQTISLKRGLSISRSIESEGSGDCHGDRTYRSGRFSA